MAHGMHSMRSAEAGSRTRAVTHTSCASQLGRVASAHVRGALAMNGRAFAMDRAHLLSMHRRPA